MPTYGQICFVLNVKVQFLQSIEPLHQELGFCQHLLSALEIVTTSTEGCDILYEPYLSDFVNIMDRIPVSIDCSWELL